MPTTDSIDTPSRAPVRKPLPAVPMLLVGISYPAVAHVAALTQRPALIAASIGLLVVLVLLPALSRGRAFAWIAIALAGCGLYVTVAAGKGLALLLLPPVLLNGIMAWLFGRTLRPGRMPLIERAARTMRGPGAVISPEVVAYARGVTQVWSGLFIALAVVDLVLAALASPGGLLLTAGLQPPVTVPVSAWSMFANVLSYVLIAALFAVEFAVRGRRFPNQPYRGFLDFARRLAAQSHMFRPIARGTGSLGKRAGHD
jgi:uncharacterized membrane protein